MEVEEEVLLLVGRGENHSAHADSRHHRCVVFPRLIKMYEFRVKRRIQSHWRYAMCVYCVCCVLGCVCPLFLVGLYFIMDFIVKFCRPLSKAKKTHYRV